MLVTIYCRVLLHGILLHHLICATSLVQHPFVLSSLVQDPSE